MKVALAHDWLVTMGGAEMVLEQIAELYPNSPIYTLFSDPKCLKSMGLNQERVINSSLQKLPMIKQLYRKFPNFFPMAIEEFDTTGFDLVISSSHAVAKGIMSDAKTCHISYIHTPMRYIWDLTHDYIRRADFPLPLEWYTKKIFHELRTWDIISSTRPDFFVANSCFIRRRIEKIYRRPATVIYPPVDLSDKIYTDKENYYVAASRHVPYKNIPLIAEAFTKMPDKKLFILGEGPDSSKVKKIIQNASNISYMGYQNRDILMEMIGKAKAFVFAAEEDFGILPVEAQSMGTPVIAYGVGGTRETIADQKTGMFFMDQTVDSIVEAVKNFESKEDRFDPSEIAQHCQQFSRKRFQVEFNNFVKESYQNFIQSVAK